MDSLSQIALGAAVGTAVLGRKVGPRAALWGAVCGTLPDLDVLISHGDPVRDFTFHRAASHSLFWLTLASPALAWIIYRLQRGAGASWRQWLALVWLALVTHPLLDAFTIYGTQLLLPFSDYPVGLGSIFIIDPLYTVPLLAGVVAALALSRSDPDRAARFNAAGLVVSSLYLAWSVAAQSHVESVAHRALAATPMSDGRLLVTPTPFNTLLWRIVVMDDDGYHEGFRSLLDRGDEIAFTAYASDAGLLAPVRDDWQVRRLAWFSKGFYSVRLLPADVVGSPEGLSTVGQLIAPLRAATAATAAATVPAAGDPDPRARVVMTDLRMGQSPWFVFSFVVGATDGESVQTLPSLQVPTERPPAAALGWLWRRVFDEQAGALPAP